MSDRSETEWIGRNSGKDALRDEIWSLLKQQGVAPIEPFGHIPSFVGAEAAAERLAALPIWRSAQVIKCNPDTAQAPVRLRALRDGKRLYMAVPRLAELRCFIELTADDLRQRGGDPAAAATAGGALAPGRPGALQEMAPVEPGGTGCGAGPGDRGRAGQG